MRRLLASVAVVLAVASPVRADYFYTAIDVPGGFNTFAVGINNAGQVVGGYSTAPPFTHGFLLTGGSYATLDAPGAKLSGVTKMSGLARSTVSC
jgi:probable HAF family extracellular repeat protein